VRLEVAVVVEMILVMLVGLVMGWVCRFCEGCVWGLEGWDVYGLARGRREP
jgi:hypothetical protein